MNKHICRNCGVTYEYCRGCLLSPISYKENGFCSKACREASENKIEEIVPLEDVEVVVINEEDTSTLIEEVVEYPYFFTTIEEEIIEEKEENKEDDYIENYGENIRAE